MNAENGQHWHRRNVLDWLLGGVGTNVLAGASDTTPELLPDLQVPIGNKTLRLHDWLGKPTIIQFWATWCGPCRDELRTLQRVSRLELDVRILALSVDTQGWKAVTPFLREHEIDLPVALATRNVCKVFRLKGVPQVLPEVILYGPKGYKLLHSLSALSFDEWREALADLQPKAR